MIRWTKHLVVPVGFSLLLVAAVPAAAGPLDPTAFAPVGPFPTAAGTYAFHTSTLTLEGPSGPVLTGVDYNGIAVFDFNAITVGSDQTFLGMGSLPLALLSRGDVTVNGTIDVSGFQGLNGEYSVPGGPGGFGSSGGPGAGKDGSATLTGAYYNAPGGGGFGGRGGNGGSQVASQGFLGFQIIPFGGGSGGSSYGNLAISLQGGSGGGSIYSRTPATGGGGGGAIEVGAVSGITVRGSILANGGSGASYGSGGGSGGGIFLHGDSVALLGVLSAQGGGGYSSLSFPLGGGGGGGGQVLIQAGPGGFTGNVGGINVSGGSGTTYPYLPFPGEDFSAAGAPGVVTINGTVVPEPTSLVLLGVGMLGVLACAWGSRLRGGATAADQGPGGPVE
jgi:hypothetical protein